MSGGMKTVDNWMLEWYASAPFNQDQMFDFIVRIQRDATATLNDRVKALEVGLEYYADEDACDFGVRARQLLSARKDNG